MMHLFRDTATEDKERHEQEREDNPFEQNGDKTKRMTMCRFARNSIGVSYWVIAGDFQMEENSDKTIVNLHI